MATSSPASLKTGGDVYAGSPPIGFTFGLGALLVFPLRFRAATVPIEAPAPATVLAAIERHDEDVRALLSQGERGVGLSHGLP
jgi:2-aminobenzoate-CoA ligase